VERLTCEHAERLLFGRVVPAGEGPVEGEDAEFGGEARARVRHAALLECPGHGRGEAGALERRALRQLTVTVDDRSELGDGADRRPAARVLDVGRLYRLALEKAPAGSPLPAAAEEGITVREIAETIGRHLGIPAVGVPAERAMEHFTGSPFVTLDITMPNAETRRLLGWEPVQLGLLADLEQGHYFTAG
jgi:nucleoside-diphosphate-sugar epimerase